MKSNKNCRGCDYQCTYDDVFKFCILDTVYDTTDDKLYKGKEVFDFRNVGEEIEKEIK